MILMTFRRTVPLLLATALAAAGCSAPNDSEPKVVTAFYALEYATKQVVGPMAEVTNLTTPGVDAHDLELSPKQVASLADAELVIYLKGFQPAVDESIENSGATRVFDVSEAAHLVSDEDGDVDPHFWLDPERLADVSDAIADELAESSELDAAALEENAGKMRSTMTEISGQWEEGLAKCTTSQFVTTHAAFGYLASAFGLEQVSIMGFSPNEDPSPARIAEIGRYAEDFGITTIFYEPLGSDTLAKTIASDLDLKAEALDPIESASRDGEDYAEIMNSNLEALRSANGCK